jgi:hypothetical protein
MGDDPIIEHQDFSRALGISAFIGLEQGGSAEMIKDH